MYFLWLFLRKNSGCSGGGKPDVVDWNGCEYLTPETVLL